MASPPNAEPPRRAAAAAATSSSSSSSGSSSRDEGAGLSQSLSQLSLGQRGPRSPGLSPSQPPSTPLNPPRHASPSASPSARAPSLSPSGRESRTATPTLVRKASMNSLHSASGVGPSRPLSRRSSLQQVVSPGLRASFGNPEPEWRPPVTASSVASGHFKDELEAHHGPVSTLYTETVVVLNDAVYGHRFSRPRTPKSALNTIVERPERIKASVLGVSAAYVRLGERHSDGALPILPKSNVHMLPSIPFRIHKTDRRLSLLSPAVTNVHGTKWMEEFKMMCESAEAVLARGGKELQRPSITRGPDHAAPETLHEGDLYLCNQSLEAIEGALGAVCEGVDAVFSAGPRRAFVAVRPPGHHCSANLPSGFCWVNNVHVGIMHGILNHGLTHAAIIDFDLHHGDGSQALAWAHNSRSMAATKNHAAWKKTSIGYFSLHDINSYPCENGDDDKIKNASICIENAHGQNIWNAHLQPWKTVEDFWDLYETKYSILLDKARSYLRGQAEKLQDAGVNPRAVIFLSAGFDASEWESAGMQRHKVNVPTEFYARLTQDVVRLAAEEGLCVDGRIVSVLEGGYSNRALTSGIISHLSGLVGKQNVPHRSRLSFPQGAYDEEEDKHIPHSPASINPYDPSWWSAGEMEKLEAAVALPDITPKKPHVVTPPTYCTPTQASTARAVDPLRMRRSMSTLVNRSTVSSRSPSPSPPEVPWTIAASELSKLLIPRDRQTDSCTFEELNADAARVRRDRQSAGVPELDRSASRMSLRDRKPRVIDPIQEENQSRQTRDRSKTVATATLAAEKATARGQTPQPLIGTPPKKTSRRLTASSAVPTQRSVSRTATSSQDLPLRPSTSAGPIAGRPLSVAGNQAQSSGSTGRITVRKSRPTSSNGEPALRSPMLEAGKEALAERTTAPAVSRLDATIDDMDKITKGIKKIKINLITQSQKEAREKARLEAEAAAAAATASGELRPSTLSTPNLEHSTPRTVSPEARQAVPNVSSPRSAKAMDEAHEFFQYQPEGPPPVSVSSQEPLKWLPPSLPAGPPAVQPGLVKKSSTLFQYGGSGTIPFAKQPANRDPSPQKVQRKPSGPLRPAPRSPPRK
ncbi:Arginase/deacetylase [Trichoderma citrinoviride]|uniref:Arginase/deacetylase n=1 Tax=Trichoderma citrinoviride TaxID=58853 RepID=A0A2T4B5Q6_9HYPO|nr:Arginase/deacetylase [Trichoderma citrinoviride]PTB64672.1 Arginase/deacetylase [Trichoderma citrinoviride]